MIPVEEARRKGVKGYPQENIGAKKRKTVQSSEQREDQGDSPDQGVRAASANQIAEHEVLNLLSRAAAFLGQVLHREKKGRVRISVEDIGQPMSDPNLEEYIRKGSVGEPYTKEFIAAGRHNEKKVTEPETPTRRCVQEAELVLQTAMKTVERNRKDGALNVAEMGELVGKWNDVVLELEKEEPAQEQEKQAEDSQSQDEEYADMPTLTIKKDMQEAIRAGALSEGQKESFRSDALQGAFSPRSQRLVEESLLGRSKAFLQELQTALKKMQDKNRIGCKD